MSNSISTNRPTAQQSTLGLTDIGFLRWLVIFNGLVPLAFILWDAWQDQLGANAVNNALHITGILSLVFLFLSLAITPLRRISGWNQVVGVRRALGLYGFWYAAIHLAIYVIYDRALSLSSTLEEIFSRRFLQVGTIALLLMVPLAITSTNGMIRRLGAKRWKQLHRLAYAVVALGVLHFYMLVKSDVRQPLAFAAVLAPLLAFRVIDQYRNSRSKASPSSRTSSSGKGGRARRFWRGRLRVAEIITETHNVKTFRFIPIEGEVVPFQHLAGQYLNIQLSVDGVTVPRSYTISSAPERTAYIEISVKREDLGLSSRYLHDNLREGDLVDISAPAGRFTFNELEYSGVTLIAGGVGVTPMMSIARSLTEKRWEGDIYFVFAVRSERDVIFQKELQQLSEKFENFHLLITLSQPSNQDTWTGVTGRLTEQMLKEFSGDIDQYPAYICGPQGMMDATCELLRQLGLPDELILTEAFVSPEVGGEKAELSTTSLDSEVSPSEVLVHFDSSDVVISATGEMNLLEIAESAGIDLPFECRSGICGQCKLKCTAGKVHMQVQSALSDVERAAGFVLACQAVPRSNEIRLDA